MLVTNLDFLHYLRDTNRCRFTFFSSSFQIFLFGKKKLIQIKHIKYDQIDIKLKRIWVKYRPIRLDNKINKTKQKMMKVYDKMMSLIL